MYGTCVFNGCILVTLFIALDFVKAEEIVTKLPNPDDNIVLKKPTRSLGGISVNANDGNMDPSWRTGTCFNSNIQDTKGYWWQVDFGDDFLVVKVKVTNRADCCPGRLRDFSLDVYTSDPEVFPTTPAKHCNSYAGTVDTPGITLTLECLTPVLGRFLRITQQVGQLQFCELQAFAGVPGPLEPCGWFTQYKGKRSSSSLITALGPEITNRAQCAEHCGRDLTCTAFNIRYQPEVTCELVHAVGGGSPVSNAAWDLYLLNPCWRKCDD